MAEEFSLIPFDLPKSFLVVGATQSGKTEFIKRLLLHHGIMFNPPPKKIIYVFSIWQDKYQEIEDALGDIVQFRTDIPSKEELCQLWEEYRCETLLILDDKMSSLNDGATGAHVVDIVCILTHHCHVSCIIALQNIFHQSKAVREIGLNSQYMCLFRNSRSARQIKHLASQSMPTQMEYFLDSYERATARNYGYLVADLAPTDENKKFQLRTNVFPGDKTVVYLPKK